MLASASNDTVALLDFKAGKKRYTRKTSDDSNLPLLNNNNYPHLLIRRSEFCLLYLRKTQT